MRLLPWIWIDMMNRPAALCFAFLDLREAPSGDKSVESVVAASGRQYLLVDTTANRGTHIGIPT